MPLIIPAELPAYEALAKETVFVMRRERAQSQKIRPLRILILNLMPTKVVTETQLARLFANSPIQMHLTFLQTATYSSTTPQEHMRAFYKTFDAVRHERYGGMVITGAPLEDMAYERVDYWGELCSIMDYSKTNVYSTLHLCWGALAGLYYHFGVRKVHLPQKLFGVFEHRVLRPPPRWCAALTSASMPPQPLGQAGWAGPVRLPRPAAAGRQRPGRLPLLSTDHPRQNRLSYWRMTACFVLDGAASTRRPAQPTPRQSVKVQVSHALPRLGAAVGHHPEVGDVQSPGHFGDDLKAVGHHPGVVHRNLPA